MIGVEFASRVAVLRRRGDDRRDGAAARSRSRTRRRAKVLQRVFRRRGIAFELGAPFQRSATPTRASGHAGQRQDARRRSCCWSPSAAGRSRPTSATRSRRRGHRPRLRRRRRATARRRSRTISAVGDLIATPQLAHVGFAEGILVAERLGGLDVRPIDYDGVPRITYSEPEVASVGITSAQAAERGHQRGRGELPARRQRQEPVILQTQGQAKVIAEAPSAPGGSRAGCSASTWSAAGSAS